MQAAMMMTFISMLREFVSFNFDASYCLGQQKSRVLGLQIIQSSLKGAPAPRSDERGSMGTSRRSDNEVHNIATVCIERKAVSLPIPHQ